MKKKIFIILALALLIAAAVLYFSYTSKIYIKTGEDDSNIEVEGIKYYKYTGNQWDIHNGDEYSDFIGYDGGRKWRIYRKEDRDDNEFVIIKYHKGLLEDKAYPFIIYVREDIEIETPSLSNIEHVEFRKSGEYERYKIYETERLMILFNILDNGDDIRIIGKVSHMCDIDFYHGNGELYYPAQMYKADNFYYISTLLDDRNIKMPKETAMQILINWLD